VVLPVPDPKELEINEIDHYSESSAIPNRRRENDPLKLNFGYRKILEAVIKNGQKRLGAAVFTLAKRKGQKKGNGNLIQKSTEKVSSREIS
jgi:hypothetical protein